MPKVKINLKNMPQGRKLEVPYLGIVENGSDVEVTDTQWARFVNNVPGGQRFDDASELVIDDNSVQAETQAHAELRAAVRAERGQGQAPVLPLAAIEGREGKGKPFIEPVARPDAAGGPPEGKGKGKPDTTPLSDRKKAELVELAEAAGVEDASDKNKDELIELLSQEG